MSHELKYKTVLVFIGTVSLACACDWLANKYHQSGFTCTLIYFSLFTPQLWRRHVYHSCKHQFPWTVWNTIWPQETGLGTQAVCWLASQWPYCVTQCLPSLGRCQVSWRNCVAEEIVQWNRRSKNLSRGEDGHGAYQSGSASLHVSMAKPLESYLSWVWRNL